jgi:hypothetical protein
MDTEDRERQPAETQFAVDLRRQFEALGERARQPRRRRRVVIAAAAAGVVVATMLGGVALAGGFASHRPPEQKPLVAKLHAAAAGSRQGFAYPTNASGQTFGPDRAGVQEPDLVAVVATNGEKGYCWWTDLDGPVPATPQEALWIQAAGGGKKRVIPVYQSDGTTQIGDFVIGGGGSRGVTADGTIVAQAAPTGTAAQPPVWLLEQMSSLARNAGDANAWAWWTMTTADKAVVVEGEDAPSSVTDPGRAVYVVIVLGDFTNWLWSLPAGVSPPTYSWVYELIDAGSHMVDGTGASARPFDATGLDLNIVDLRAAGAE